MLVTVLGLVIGSFINVVVLRTQAQLSWWGRSACPHCSSQLAWYDLFPVASFLVLRGQCRQCQSKIAWQYPVVESVTALVFALLAYWFYADPVRLLMYLVYASSLIVIFVYDLKYYLILDRFTLPMVVFALMANQILGVSLSVSVFGMMVGAAFFLVQFLWSRGRWVGGGDIRLGAVMGAMLGWPQICVALFLAYGLGTIVAVALLAIRKTTLQGQFPFGTCLTLATLITLLFGQQLLYWYLHDLLYVWTG